MKNLQPIAPSKEWLAQNLSHHLIRGDEEEVNAIRTVATIALTNAEFAWMEREAKDNPCADVTPRGWDKIEGDHA